MTIVKTKAAVRKWVEARLAEGYWVSVCLSCGTWFAQKRAGRRGIICGLKRCEMWRHYQTEIGRAPPDWLVAKWREEQGDLPAASSTTPFPRWRCGIQEAA